MKHALRQEVNSLKVGVLYVGLGKPKLPVTMVAFDLSRYMVRFGTVTVTISLYTPAFT